jgi:SAM-dependent methyltransferase
MDAKTDELRAAHDVLAELYAERLADALDRMPAERAVLGMFCELTLAAVLGTGVGDVGCGTGRLEPYLAARGLSPHGIDLSPEMIRVARRDHPGFEFGVADVRELPFEDASLAGVVCWYSLMYLAPSERPAAFSELARVVRPRGYLVTAFKAGDGQVRRGGRSTGLGIRHLLVVSGRDGAHGGGRRIRDCVLGRAPSRGAGGFATGVSARSEVLKPARSSPGSTLSPGKKSGSARARKPNLRAISNQLANDRYRA